MISTKVEDKGVRLHSTDGLFLVRWCDLHKVIDALIDAERLEPKSKKPGAG